MAAKNDAATPRGGTRPPVHVEFSVFGFQYSGIGKEIEKTPCRERAQTN
jgi:hypothetical protein